MKKRLVDEYGVKFLPPGWHPWWTHARPRWPHSSRRTHTPGGTHSSRLHLLGCNVPENTRPKALCCQAAESRSNPLVAAAVRAVLMGGVVVDAITSCQMPRCSSTVHLAECVPLTPRLSNQATRQSSGHSPRSGNKMSGQVFSRKNCDDSDSLL